MDEKNTRYEYETITLRIGGTIYKGDLDDLSSLGYRYIGYVPLTQTDYKDGEQSIIPNGSQLIFERRKEE